MIEEEEQLRLVVSKLLTSCCDPYSTFFLAHQFSLPSPQVDLTSQYFYVKLKMELTRWKTEAEAELSFGDAQKFPHFKNHVRGLGNTSLGKTSSSLQL